MREQDSAARILVALDKLPQSSAVMDTASALAAELDAELAGLYVEDADLARLMALPFARELCTWSGALRPLSQAEIERAWRREAAAVQRQLAEAASQFRLRWSFRVARSRLAAEARRQAQGFDLVVLGVRATPRSQPARGPVLALYDPRQPAGRFELALRLARRSGTELVVLMSERDAAVAPPPSGGAAPLRRSILAHVDADSLLRVVRHEGAGSLLVPEQLLQADQLKRMLDEIGCPLVLVR